MIKARIATTAAAASVLLLTAACSGGTDEAGTTDSLDIWLPTPFGAESASSEEGTWEEMLVPFEEEHDVDITVTLIPWDSYEEKYLTGVSSGEGPDVGYMYTEMMGDYITNGALAPFDDYLDQDAASTMLYLPQGQIDGKQYAMPFVVGGMRVLYANTDILHEAGVQEVPQTWDDFFAAAEKVSAAGYTPILQSWGAPDRGMLNSTFFPTLWQSGGSILNEDGSATAFNSPEGLQAAQFIQRLLDSGAMPSTVTGLVEDDVKSAFYDGQSAFMYGTDATRVEIEDAGINADFVVSLEGEEQGTFVASDALVMLEACPDKQLCTDLVQFILAGDQMSIFHDQIVPYPPIGTDEEPQADNEFASVYADNADILHTLPIAAGSAEVYNSLYTNLQQMVLGQKTPEQALQDAADAGDAALQGAQS